MSIKIRIIRYLSYKVLCLAYWLSPEYVTAYLCNSLKDMGYHIQRNPRRAA